MSVRSELARLGTRWFIKGAGPFPSIDASRRYFARLERFVPLPPADTKTTAIAPGGVKAEQVVTPRSQPDRHLLYLHGGAYTNGSPQIYRNFTWRIASTTRAIVTAIDYRLAPEHPFPAALDDAAAAYRALLSGDKASAGFVVMGDSAGGGLTLALLLKLRDEGTDLPAAAVALSPWTDLALSGASIRANARADPMVNPDDAAVFARLYLAGADPRTPYASPLYGDPAGLPPTLIQVGSDEILRDDAERMAANMRTAGCQVELEVWRRMPHVWQLFSPVLPEADQAIARIGRFVDRNLVSAE